MKKGILTDLDWKYIGAVLASEGDDVQADFFKSFLKECLAWGTFHQVESQLAAVNMKLTDQEKDLIGMLGYKEEI